ncbi:hypothetical protein SAMN02745687_00934 [Lachnospiraceae bacterium NK3A20]|nr:hypothetical protein SAMN02745687_00934 [Lachnospiraceae bacterium NK3A20]
MEYMGEVRIKPQEESEMDYGSDITITPETASSEAATQMQIKYGGYKGFKAKLDFIIGRTANDFIEIGQMLKEARDTDILKDSGYSGMGEFAEKEYGLRPDQTSRFIGIYEKFGTPDGELKAEYREHGITKLSEMLALPDSVAAAIPASLSKEEIRTIKDEVKEEQAITPLEVAMEGQQADEPLTAMLKAYFHTRPEDYRKLFEKSKEAGAQGEINVFDALAPSGVAVLESRPTGMGKVLLTFDGEDKKPKLTQIREDTTEEVEWLDLQNVLDELTAGPMGEFTDQEWQTPEEAWQGLYGEEMPKTPISPNAEGNSPEKSEAKVKIAPAQLENAGKADNPQSGAVTEDAEKETEEETQSKNVPAPEPKPETPPRGTPEAREAIAVIKDKINAVKIQLSAIGHIRADEEQYLIQDAMEKYENASQELIDAVNDLSMLRLKEEREN